VSRTRLFIRANSDETRISDTRKTGIHLIWDQDKLSSTLRYLTSQEELWLMRIRDLSVR
jgi:hypothetical protein